MSRFGDLGGRLYRGDFSFNIVGNKRLWYSVSAGLIVLALVGLLVRGLNLGIEFKGGAEFYVPSASCEIQDVREAVADTGVEAAAVTEIGSQNIRAQTAAVTPEQGRAIVDALATTCDVSADQVSSRDVGPTWGGEITRTALIGLAVFLSLLAVFLTVYFQWKMAVAALVALAHDIVITAGIYALWASSTPATVIGLLTILDSPVRHRLRQGPRERHRQRRQSRYTYSELANLALNQTIIRSINTSIVALLPVASILFVGAFLLGAGALKDLALVLFIGTAVGTYSSIFVATPVLCQMEEREPAMKARAARVMKRRAARGEAPTPGGTAPAESQKAAVGSDAGGVATAVDRPHRQHRDAGTRVQPKRQSRSKRKH